MKSADRREFIARHRRVAPHVKLIPNWIKESGSVDGNPVSEETVADVGEHFAEMCVIRKIFKERRRLDALT